mgnify:CR=1 FL=1
MALPKLNDTPQHELNIPSTGKTVKYRPYLVKEEKVLLLAFETQDQKQMMNAMVNTIVACVQEDIDKTKLTTFDVEYMFLQIRGKSVGETATVGLKCAECENVEEIEVNLDEITVPEKDLSNMIELTPEIFIEMRYPTFLDVGGIVGDDREESQIAFDMIEKSIAAVISGDERIADFKKQEITDFVESMTSTQLEKVSQFIREIPSLQKQVDYTCTECGHDNTIKLEGISDFF